MDAYIGTILPWPLNWAPANWTLCNGQSLQLNQNQALFSLIGYSYGGSGNTFNLPNLQGRVPIGVGQDNVHIYPFGARGGNTQTTISPSQIPLNNHAHQIASTASVTGGSSGTTNVEVKIPVNTDAYPNPMPTPPTYVNVPGQTCTFAEAKAGSFTANIYTTNAATANQNLRPFNASASFSVAAPTVNVSSNCSPQGIAPTKQLSTLPPYTTVNYIICLQGYYPIRP